MSVFADANIFTTVAIFARPIQLVFANLNVFDTQACMMGLIINICIQETLTS